MPVYFICIALLLGQVLPLYRFPIQRGRFINIKINSLAQRRFGNGIFADHSSNGAGFVALIGHFHGDHAFVTG